jgi:hypothetical protein
MKEILVLCDQLRPEAALEERADTALPAVDTLGERDCETMHSDGEIVHFGSDQEVVVVGHQAIRNDLSGLPGEGMPQPLEKERVVLRAEEDRRPIYPPGCRDGSSNRPVSLLCVLAWPIPQRNQKPGFSEKPGF